VKVGDLVFYWPLMANEPSGTAVLLEFDEDEWADLEERGRRPSYRVLMDGGLVWIRERDLREMP